MQKILKFASLSALAVGTAIACPAYAEQGDVLIRARAIAVAPNEKSSSILPAFPGEKVSVDDSFAPELDITYMATNHIGFELIAATTKHSASGVSGTTGTLGKLASTWVLFFSLTAQYHFAPGAKVRPYVGAGINYTVFYNTKATPALVGAVGATSVGMTDSIGYVVQTGVDIDLTDRVFLNLDVKYIDINTTAYLTTANAGVQRVRVNLDPLVFGIGIGIKL